MFESAAAYVEQARTNPYHTIATFFPAYLLN